MTLQFKMNLFHVFTACILCMPQQVCLAFQHTYVPRKVLHCLHVQHIKEHLNSAVNNSSQLQQFT